MSSYKFNVKEIRQKVEHSKELLKGEISPEEKEKIQMSLVAYLGLLNSTSNTKLFNFLDQMTHGKFSESRFKKYECLTGEISGQYLSGSDDYIDDNYLQFLINLSNNIASPYLESPKFNPINISADQMVQVATSFYQSLGDPEILSNYQRIISKPNSITISEDVRSGDENFRGICNYDHLYNQPYVTVHKSNDIYDFSVLSHEIMHGIDFYMLPKLLSKNYYGFHEVPTYTAEYLIADFLENMGIDKSEVDKFKSDKDNYLKGLASQVHFDIRRKLKQKGININEGYSIGDIKSILDPELMKKLLEVESGIMSYGFYQQIKNDREQGLSALKKFMKSNIPKDRVPDFTQYGLSNDVLLQLSQEFALSTDYTHQQNQTPEQQLNNTKVRKLIKPNNLNNHAFISSFFLLAVILVSGIFIAISILAIR